VLLGPKRHDWCSLNVPACVVDVGKGLFCFFGVVVVVRRPPESVYVYVPQNTWTHHQTAAASFLRLTACIRVLSVLLVTLVTNSLENTAATSIVIHDADVVMFRYILPTSYRVRCTTP